VEACAVAEAVATAAVVLVVTGGGDGAAMVERMAT
jgi:hypothetical protein